jgi:ssDNA-specific exonuclease RecJ
MYRTYRDELNQITAERLMSDLHAFVEQLHASFRDKAPDKILFAFGTSAGLSPTQQHNRSRGLPSD